MISKQKLQAAGASVAVTAGLLTLTFIAANALTRPNQQPSCGGNSDSSLKHAENNDGAVRTALQISSVGVLKIDSTVQGDNPPNRKFDTILTRDMLGRNRISIPDGPDRQSQFEYVNRQLPFIQAALTPCVGPSTGTTVAFVSGAPTYELK